METTNRPVTTPATAGSSSCDVGSQDSGGWLSRRSGLILVGGAVAAAVALALSQHWLTVAQLTLLLFLLPCALMTLMCMKGMNHDQPSGDAQGSTNTDKPSGTSSTHLPSAN